MTETSIHSMPHATLTSAERETVTIKFVITGPFAAGKTTLVKTMSEIPVVGTETSVTDSTSAIKSDTTVSMDFGKLTIVDADLIVELSLFGTPGQDRFRFMWDVLAEGMDGYVVLVDLTRPETLDEGRAIVEHFRAMSSAPFVIGANKGTGDPDELAGVAERVAGDPDAIVVACDASDQESAKGLLLVLLESVLASLGAEATL